MDLFGFDIKFVKLKGWKKGWVGKSKITCTENNPFRNGLYAIRIGKEGSPLSMQAYNFVHDREVYWDIDYRAIFWGNFPGPIMHLAWDARPIDGSFPSRISNFSFFTGSSANELLNYMINWGR